MRDDWVDPLRRYGNPSEITPAASSVVLNRWSLDLWVRSSRQVVLTALAQDGNAFQFADLNLRGDREFVLQIVSNG